MPEAAQKPHRVYSRHRSRPESLHDCDNITDLGREICAALQNNLAGGHCLVVAAGDLAHDQ